MRTIKLYSRMISLIFTQNLKLPRALKALALDMQIFTFFAFIALFVAGQKQDSVSVGEGIICTFLFMRLLEVINWFCLSRNGNFNCLKNCLVIFVYLFLAIITHLMVLGFAIEATAKEFSAWASIMAVGALLEFIVWDFVVFPAIVINLGKVSPKVRNVTGI